MKKDYMTRLERWARWRLPWQEAEDVIADYRDIVGVPPRPEEELLRELGKPRNVIRPLVSLKTYGIWLAVFALLTACILVPGLSPLWLFINFYRLCFGVDTFGWLPTAHLGPVFALLGMIWALIWFRLQGRKVERLSSAIPVLLAVFLTWVGAALLFNWLCLRDFDGFANAWGTIIPFIGPGAPQPKSLYLSRCALIYAGPVLALIGEFGLVKARTGDRRWAAVYILAMTAMLVSIESTLWYYSMDISIPIETEIQATLTRCAGFAAVGIVGSGVALC